MGSVHAIALSVKAHEGLGRRIHQKNLILSMHQDSISVVCVTYYLDALVDLDRQDLLTALTANGSLLFSALRNGVWLL